MDIVLGRGKPSISMKIDDTSIAAAAAGHVLISFAIILQLLQPLDMGYVYQVTAGINEGALTSTSTRRQSLPSPPLLAVRCREQRREVIGVY